jgi:ABC-type glycerol-3-phosphate transport system substrate-binding protein
MNQNFFSGLNKQQIIILAIGIVVILIVILGVTGILPIFKADQQTDPNFPSGKITLQVWGVGDETAAFAQIAQSYKTQSVAKDVSVQYTKFDNEDIYQRTIVEALAAGQGPDLFMVKNSWIPKNLNKLYPAPTSLVTPLMVQQAFPQAVYMDSVKSATDGSQYVYGLPLHFDTLALLYNKDIFNAHAIVYPPTTWQAVVDSIPKLREMDARKNITVSPIALGTAATVQNFDDIVPTLMMQSGSTINNTSGGVLFDAPAQKAIEFYMQFANPTNLYYSWNDTLGNSRDAFAEQKTAMIVDYYNAIAKIKAKNNFINIGVATLPQLSNNTQDNKTLASYWVLGVSRWAKQPYVAWHFARFTTMSPNVNAAYLTATGKLPALLSLIQKDLDGENSVFLKSFLYARTWVRNNNDTVQNALGQMISNIATGRTDIQRGARVAQEEINNSQ